MTVDRSTESPPTQPATRRARGPWWQFPWLRSRTRIAAPADDDGLLIRNRTDEAWALHLGYRDLGTIAPRSDERMRVVKSGMLTARKVDAPEGTDYLAVHLTERVTTIEIRRAVIQGTPVYDLRLIERRQRAGSER